MRRRFNAVSWLCAWGLVAVLSVASGHAIARELWLNDYLEFFSKDMQPVQVTLLHDRWKRGLGGISFSVPRAWITFTSGYDPLKLDRLPDRIETEALRIELSDPDGTALSIRSTEYARTRNVGWSQALMELRPEIYLVAFSMITLKMSQDEYNQKISKGAVVERFGLPYDPNRGDYLLRLANGQVVMASCAGDPHPIRYCTYWFRINPNVSVTMTFLDFRVHGGTTYAVARIGRALDVLCRQPGLDCSEVPHDAH